MDGVKQNGDGVMKEAGAVKQASSINFCLAAKWPHESQHKCPPSFPSGRLRV